MGLNQDAQFTCAVMLALATVAAAPMLNLSVLLTLLALGTVSRALDYDRRFTALSFRRIGAAFFFAAVTR